MESLRLTHGVITGPPRQVGSKGGQVDSYTVPPKVYFRQFHETFLDGT